MRNYIVNFKTVLAKILNGVVYIKSTIFRGCYTIFIYVLNLVASVAK